MDALFTVASLYGVQVRAVGVPLKMSCTFKASRTPGPGLSTHRASALFSACFRSQRCCDEITKQSRPQADMILVWRIHYGVSLQRLAFQTIVVSPHMV